MPAIQSIIALILLICSSPLLANEGSESDSSILMPDSPVVTVTEGSGVPGHTVVVTVSLDDAPGVAGAQFAVSYDASVLTPTQVEASDRVSAGKFMLVPNFETNGIVRVALACPIALQAGDGPLFSITFDIDSDAETGSYPLILVSSTVVSELGAPIHVTTRNGAAIVRIIPGDIDNDGAVTTADAEQALKFALKQDAPTPRQRIAADVNEDGEITIGDVVLIQRLASGLDGPSTQPASDQPEADAPESRKQPAPTGPGTVELVAGDLAYVTGLNGSAPLWSDLIVKNGQGDGARLEVVKELAEMIVARVTDPNGTGVKPGDAVAFVGLGSHSSLRRSRRIVYATYVDTGPVLDGELNDAVWAQAIKIEGFVQRDPNYWMPSPEKTVAMLLYDSKNIYFGFECPVPDASGTVANNMRRDSEISGDDNIQILLDTYNDRQNGFFFFVNALGAQSDLMLSDEGRSYNRDWDCNWISRTKRYPDRWTAEVAIPFSQLRFKQQDEMTWGINLARFNARKNQASQLVVGQQSSSSTERYRMADIGELRGLKRVRSKRSIQVKPYALPGTTIDYTMLDPEKNSTIESGFDLRYGVTSNISLDLSYNTDFAQVEGDQEQTNLTQFRLFFPEKREFFLEGANLFQFGEAARIRGSGSRPPTLLFYSRRIGLEEGGKIPIILGTKVVGKEGRTSIGALNVMTDAAMIVDDDDTTLVHRTNYSVLRVRRDVFSSSNFGFIFVNKQIDGWSRYNRAGGIDFNYSPTRNLNFQAYAARTWDSEIGDADDSRFVSLNYRGNKYWTRLKFLDVEEQFEPAVGFVNRRSGLDGFRRYDLYARWRPRPKFGNIRYMSIGPEAQVITDRNNNVKYWIGELSWFTSFNSGDFWFVNAERIYDVVDEEFSPSDRREDVIIPAGNYTFTSIRTGLRPSRTRKFRPGFSFQAGTYYTGERYTFRSRSAILPSGRFSWEIEYSGNWLRLPQGNLSLHTLSSRLLYNFSTDFFAKLFVQWNNDKQSVGANFLVNYRYRPGSDIFVVFDNAYDTVSGLERQNRSVLVKLSYLLNL